MIQEPEGEEGNGCLKYIVEVKTKSPIDERKKTIVVRNINLNIWKALDEHLPKDICCSVYSQEPEHDNQMREEGAEAVRERSASLDLEKIRDTLRGYQRMNYDHRERVVLVKDIDKVFESLRATPSKQEPPQ